MTTTGSNMAEGLFASNAPFFLRTNDKNIEKKRRGRTNRHYRAVGGSAKKRTSNDTEE